LLGGAGRSYVKFINIGAIHEPRAADERTAVGVWHAHRHAVQRHRFSMIGIFSGALVVAGFFTFAPGRIMHKILFGG